MTVKAIFRVNHGRRRKFDLLDFNMHTSKQVPDFVNSLTATEQSFLVEAVERYPGARVYRNGWPDFLFEHEGRAYGVEVKSENDDLRPGQRIMFDALERAGIKTYIWSPSSPRRLVYWRRFRSARRHSLVRMSNMILDRNH